MSTNSNANHIAELQRIRQSLSTIETDNPVHTEESALVPRHNELVDVLWAMKLHTVRRHDPAKYFPVEIVNLIFSFVIYHVVELESDNPLWRGMLLTPSSQITTGQRDAPLILVSVSRTWYDIATNYPPLWSTIFIDQLEGERLQRILLFLDRSGKELLDIILLDPVTPTEDLRNILMKHSHRFKSFVGLSAKPPFAPKYRSRIEPLETSAPFVNWCIYAPGRRKISTVPIAKCLHRVELRRCPVDARSFVQLTYFHDLESLCIHVVLKPKDAEWDKKLWSEYLRQFRFIMWPWGTILDSPWLEWLECC